MDGHLNSHNMFAALSSEEGGIGVDTTTMANTSGQAKSPKKQSKERKSHQALGEKSANQTKL